MDPPHPPPSGQSKDASTSVPGPQNTCLIATPLPPPTTKRRRTAPSAQDCCRTCRLRKGTGLAPIAPDSSSHALSAILTHLQPLLAKSQEPPHPLSTQKQARCKRCEASDLVCEYTQAKRKFTNVRVSSSADRPVDAPASTQDASSSGPSIVSANHAGSNHVLAINAASLTAEELLFRKDIIMKHMDAYFEYIYYMPCMGFFRRNKVYQEIQTIRQDGEFPAATAAAMCAVTSLFVNPCEAGRVFAMKCSDDIELYVFRSIFRFDEEIMILYALNCYHNFLHGHLAKVWQCFGIATRLMVGLQVNWDVRPRDRSFAEQETMRRIVWQLFYLDRLLAGGYDEYIMCRDDIVKIRLPCREEDFREDRPVVVERMNESPGTSKGTMGIHGYQLRLIDVRHRILVSARKMSGGQGANKPCLEPSKVMSNINGFQNELSQINASLPPDLRPNEANIARAMASEYATGFVFIHTCLASVHMDLYSFCLPGLREQVSADLLRKLPREFVTKSQKQAVAHALTLARFCDTLQHRLEAETYAGKLKLVGCSSMVKFTTQCLRVLLTALQHNLYRDLADHTTAPIWRSEPADEPHIRGLIESLLKISSLTETLQYDRNKAAVEQFYKTRKYADQKPLSPLPKPQTTGAIRLPGPQHILETAFVLPVEEARTMQTNPAIDSARWFGVSKPATEPLQEGGFDAEYGPPGLPMFLAEAQGVQPTPTDDVDTFDATDDLLLISNKMMQMPSFGHLLPSDDALNVGSDAPSAASFDNVNSVGVFQPPAHLPISTSEETQQGEQQARYTSGYSTEHGSGSNEHAYTRPTGR
ncbi:hypothetical protein B0T10DRAFT_455113 [Thelonectria olida]|uniref:Xylanolytic transcriptional activator regulatory domain-containing protein n=1 Tax=Thelonectria olida TaxID=1576542 RepID=A0A9P9ARY7_9HYPO|nr:hypothetical protein B0T10DRAFT_455113 [Thelonectria olida]